MTNENRSPIKRLTQESFKANRSRNIIAIVAIAMTAIMFTTVFTVGFSMIQSMAALGASIGTGAQGSLIAIMTIALILISGYLIIYNIFQISVTQDIRFYGLLKALGATKKQLARIIVGQGLRLWGLGLPIGLVLGYGVGTLVMPIMLTGLGAAAQLSFNPLIFLFSGLFTLITVLLSCLKPAALAGKVSPVVAMKYVEDGYTTKSNTKQTKPNFSLRSMATANLGRNKKRTISVIISITMGFTLMNSLFVMQHSYDKETYVDSFIGSDLLVAQKDAEFGQKGAAKASALSNEVLAAVEQDPAVTRSGRVYYTEMPATLEPTVKERMVRFYGQPESEQRYWIESEARLQKQYDQIKTSGTSTVSVYGMNDFTAQMGTYHVGAFDQAKFASGNYVVALGNQNQEADSVPYQGGEKITIAGKEYELLGVMEPKETLKRGWHSDANQIEIDYVIPEARFRAAFPDIQPSSVFADFTSTDERNALAQKLEADYDQYAVESTLSYEARFQASVMGTVVMGYTLGVIIAIIGVLNFVNAMLTAIVARKREFAMLESVGMTAGQLKKMLIYEGLSYAFFTLILSLIFSTIAAFTFVQESLSTSWAATFDFTLLPFLLVGPLLIALAVIIPVSCFKGTQEKSLVERLRETTA